MRAMGLDYGTVRIGVAISDSMLITANPLPPLRRDGTGKSYAKLFAELLELTVAHDVGLIVVGLPKNMNNTEGPLAREVRLFAERLENELSIPVVLWDERLTSAQAERELISAEMSRKKRKERIDGVSAALILQNYLQSTFKLP